MFYNFNIKNKIYNKLKNDKTNEKNDKIEQRRLSKMRISTAEIKMLIKECVKQGGMYTAPDFKEYIILNSKKDVTRGQISGAVSQLIDTKEIVRVGRGLYARDM